MNFSVSDHVTDTAILTGTRQPTADDMWEALKKFGEGGLYEAMLRDLPVNHPNHDWLYRECGRAPIPSFCKTVLDGVLPEIVHNQNEEKGNTELVSKKNFRFF